MIDKTTSINVCQFGAVGDGVTDDTAAIQAAIESVAASGGGVVFLPAGTFAFDGHKGSQPYWSPSIRGGFQMRAGVVLQGSGRSTVLKNISDESTAGISIRGGANIELRDFVLDMDWPNRSAAEIAFSTTRGEGIIFWNGNYPSTDNVISNVLVKNTGHYGIGVQNVNVKRLRIEGCVGLNIGGDFIDVKEFVADPVTGLGACPKVGVVIADSWVDTFGLNATAAQMEADAAGFDLRGEVLASNIHVYNLNSYNEPDTGNPMLGATGIRINGDIAVNNRLGGRKVRVIGGSVTSNKAAGEGSETVKRIIGVRVGSKNSSVVGVVVDNCYIGFRAILTGDSSPSGTQIVGCQAINSHGAAGDGRGVSLEGASPAQSTTVDVFSGFNDVGFASNGVGGTGRVTFAGNTVDHTLTEDNLRLNNYQFVSSSPLSTVVSRPTPNNMQDLTVWGLTEPSVRIRSTFDGGWISPYNMGAVMFESADVSGAGAGVRAELRARQTGATGGGTGLVLRANAGAGLVDAVTVNGDSVMVNPALLRNFSSDAAAAAGGVLVNCLYRNGGTVMVRLT